MVAVVVVVVVAIGAAVVTVVAVVAVGPVVLVVGAATVLAARAVVNPRTWLPALVRRRGQVLLLPAWWRKPALPALLLPAVLPTVLLLVLPAAVP